VEPSSGDPEQFLVRIARGARAVRLTHGTVFGPFGREELHERVRETVEQLYGEGFFKAGLHALFHDLQSRHSVVRARAIERLGWMREKEAVDRLLAMLPNAVDETCSLLDALGAIGDTRAAPELREYAKRKLLSRRRSACEALLNLRDREGLEQVRKAALERLPAALRAVVESLDAEETDADTVGKVVEALATVPQQELGITLDTLFEVSTPLVVHVVRAMLEQVNYDQANVWRYIKSIYKRALLRHEPATFGLLSHAIERQGRTSAGRTETVKSGFDGQMRRSGIFKRGTQKYLRRLSWRYLRKLARRRPELYPAAAAEAIIAYRPEDGDEGQRVPFGRCYLLCQILYGNSPRYSLDSYRLAFRQTGRRLRPGDREESYPELWDAQSWAYLRVLGAAQIVEAHEFALPAFRVHPQRDQLLSAASHAQIIGLLSAPYPPTVDLGLEELDRRFDPENPDWDLFLLLLADANAKTRALAHRWLRRTVDLWATAPSEMVAFLQTPHHDTHDLILHLAGEIVAQQPELRKQLAAAIWAALQEPETATKTHVGLLLFARACLVEELNLLVRVEQLVEMISRGSASAQSLAGELLGHRPEAVEQLGLEKIVQMAQHELASVRSAAHQLLRAAREWLRRDPSCLFILVESEWEDTRIAAFDLLRLEIDPQTLGLEGLVGLLDSNRLDVQELGRELVIQHFSAWPTSELLDRLVQHPHPRMRRFAMHLVAEHLNEGAEALSNLNRFFRSAMFDLWPSRAEKQKVVEYLTTRGLKDAEQAKFAAVLLRDVVFFQGRADFERALEGLVRLKLAWPEAVEQVALQGELA